MYLVSLFELVRRRFKSVHFLAFLNIHFIGFNSISLKIIRMKTVLQAFCALNSRTELQNGRENMTRVNIILTSSNHFKQDPASSKGKTKTNAQTQNNKNISSSEFRLKNAIQISLLFVLSWICVRI